MQKGKIGVTSENLFPIIKKFLYSDHDIFLREIVSNAVDATQKLKTLAAVGQYKGNVENLKVSVSFDKEAKTLTISDNGIGMTAEEIDQYINQIAFSGANEFVEKYKNDANAIIGHFGLGFYSSFMISERVEIISRSYKEGAQAVRWECDGSPDYVIEDADRDSVGTDIIMHVNEDSVEFLEENKINDILNKYCKFLPIPVIFGKKKEWKDGTYVEGTEDNQINDTNPAWTRKPADLKDEDYKSFYHQLYPVGDEPLFNIHLNVDYPFNLTGILYFPKLKNTIEIQKNKIQLYSNQVFVTDSVEGVVPEFLTLLHGVLDSPDIPLNVSRSYLQGDSNVKKISSHITKKVADRLNQIFKESRSDFENKWDDLKIFIEYGMLTEEKFYEKAQNFFLFKNTDGKCFTIEEYEKLIKENQTDKDKKVVHLYASNVEEQFSFIRIAKDKGYDVLLMDEVLSTPLINMFEEKFKDSRFVRVDSDVIEKIIRKEDNEANKLDPEKSGELTSLFQGVVPEGKGHYLIDFESLGENGSPMVITRDEFMRRMKDMSKMQAGMSFYGELPDSYHLVVNIDHPLVKNVIKDKEEKIDGQLKALNTSISELSKQKEEIEKVTKDKKDEEISQVEKDTLSDVEKQLDDVKNQKIEKLKGYGKENKLARQLVDLALLANGLLKGEDLDRFVNRSLELIKN
ncbi:MAG: molecular chaperone HtpG [Bacteroidota bacterium]|nr:molecular chaperone HtpG [Bacteroidota bacterium]